MWYYEGNEFNDTPQQYQGFVYIITELDTGMKYLGKKFFWSPKVLPVTKTRKKKTRTRVESDWRDYFGSSKEVQMLVEQKGRCNYRREIVKLCKTKGECSYWEAKLQFEYDVLLKPEQFYNSFIGCKIHRKHVT